MAAKSYKRIIEPVQSKTLSVGFNELGSPVDLRKEHLDTHALFLGATRTGKTRLMTHLLSCVMKFPRAAIVVLDPKGDIAGLTLKTAIAEGHSKRLDVFDPSSAEYVVGFNPLAMTEDERADRACVSYKAKGLVEAVGAALGQTAFDKTPRLRRWLFVAFAAALEAGIDMVDALDLLRSESPVRARVMARIKNPLVRRELTDFQQFTQSRREEVGESTMNRLFTFVADDRVRRVLTRPPLRSLSLPQIVKEQRILSIDLSSLKVDDKRLLGRFLLNDLIGYLFARLKTDDHTPVFIFIDEVQNFPTPDLCRTLDQGSGLGARLCIACQDLGQLDEETETSGKRHSPLYSAAMSNCRTKVAFGGMSVEELRTLAPEFFLDQFDPWEVKHQVDSLELDPYLEKRIVRGTNANRSHGTSVSNSTTIGVTRGESESEHDAVTRMDGWSHASSSGSSSGETVGSGFSQNSGSSMTTDADGNLILSNIDSESSGASEGHSESSSSAEMTSESRSEAVTEGRSSTTSTQESESESNGVSESTSTSEGESEQETWVTGHKKRRIPSAVQFLPESEFLTLQIQKLMELDEGESWIKVSGKPALFLTSPLVEPFVTRRHYERAIQRIFERPCYTPLKEVKAEEEKQVAKVRAKTEFRPELVWTKDKEK